MTDWVTIKKRGELITGWGLEDDAELRARVAKL